MTTTLPANLITQVSELLTPLMQQPDERDAYLTEAFYITDRLLYSQMTWEGPLTRSQCCASSDFWTTAAGLVADMR